MEYVILGLLMINSMTLYELNQSFKSSISLFYSASYGSLQSAAKKLIKNTLVEIEEKIEGGRNKKIFHINPNGQKAFTDWMMSDIPTKKLEVMALSKLHFLGLISNTEDKKSILKNILDTIELVEKELYSLNQKFSQIEVGPSYKNIMKYQMKTLDYGIFSHKMSKHWFQDVYDELDSK